LVGFFRPRLQDGPPKHDSSAAGKALPARLVGIAARVGSVGAQRLAVPCLLVRSAGSEASEAPLQTRLLPKVQAKLADDAALVCARGLPLTQRQAAGMPRDVARGPMNCTARRAPRPAAQGKGRTPRRGALVRPLPRQYKHHTMAAPPPDRQETWQVGTRTAPLRLHAACWDGLVLADAQPEAPMCSPAVLHAPRFDEPWRLNPALPRTGAHLQAFYLEPWPVAGLPLTAKQRLGAARQFVLAPESRQRRPALALVAGAIRRDRAAPQPAIPTGCWDRAPKPTAGRLRRVLAQVHGAAFVGLPEQLRTKQSPTAHLPQGVRGHRRHQKAAVWCYDMPLAA
jgi:hypothetical protein